MSQTNNSEALVVATFKNHPIPNEAQSIAEGRPIYDSIELCEIKLGGNKKTVGAFPAHAFTPGWTEDPETGFRSQVTYAEKYKKQYLAFKDNNTQTQSGTPLTVAGFLTPAKVLELRALNIHTVEALAAIDGQPLRQLGMNGRTYQKQAAEYLENATGPAAEAVQKLANEKLTAQLEELQAEMSAMKADKAPKAAEKTVAEASVFDDYEDEDISNWLKEMGVDVHHLWKRPRLLTEANKKNAELAKEKETPPN